jgi:HD-like signal output (HDOD) protein
MLVERWQFPKNLSEAIRHHHDGTISNSTLHHCLFVADQLSKHKTLCNSGTGMVNELPAAMADRFGGNLDEIIVQLGDLSNVIAEAQAFAQTSKEIRP